ncbi:SelT/SelW/SelH family protein [Halolamina salifodinae]|uniref:Selenoprotein W-related protein n=1 Tax=Halolamina salifodinae TaxID=1202767 RepID=A0A8T4GU79_9EURY|nr:Rdx family protein [Halolamina salifodinae]MBP1986436.1 selenoprotein W-related protein [Halolamina salifodinae]
MVSVEIEYCVPCGHRSRAQDLAESVLEEYGLKVDRVGLVTGDGGVFEVRVDGETIFDVDEDAYDADAIVDEIGTHVGATA